MVKSEPFQKIKRCSRCILAEDFPRIQFDAQGICSGCRNWDAKWKGFDYAAAEKRLLAIFEAAKAKKRQFDCLITFSGGRDSTYALYLCKVKYGLRPLVVTFNNGFLSEYALHNIFNTAKALGVQHILHTYPWTQLKKFYRTTTTRCGEFCSVCACGINYVKFTYQEKFNIPLIIAGTSTRVDEQSPFEVICSHPAYVRKILRLEHPAGEVDDFLIPRRNDFSTADLIRRKLTDSDYININLPDYLRWNNQDIQEVLSKQLDWRTPDARKDHIDCKFAAVKYYLKNQQIPGFIFKQEKFSQLIRDGQMDREQALDDLFRAIDQETEPEVLPDFLKTLDLERTFLDRLRHVSHLDYVSRDDLVKKVPLSERILSAPWKAWKALRA